MLVSAQLVAIIMVLALKKIIALALKLERYVKSIVGVVLIAKLNTQVVYVMGIASSKLAYVYKLIEIAVQILASLVLLS